MKFLRVKTTEGETEFFNPDKILTILPRGDKAKILLGANMYWWVWLDSIKMIDAADNDIPNIFKEWE